MPRWLMLWVVVICLLAVVKPLAAGSPKVIVVAPHDDPLAVQLRSELIASGFDPMAMEHPGAVVPRTFLEQTAAQYQALGVLNVVAGATAVQVWTQSPGLASWSLVDMIYEDGSSDTDRSLVAVRAVEALRAGLSRKVVRKSTSVPAAPMHSWRDPPAPSHHAMSLSFAPALILSPGGVGPLWNADLRLGWRLPSSLLLQLHASLPMSTSSVSSERGTSKLKATTAVASFGAFSGQATHGYAAIEAGLLHMEGSGAGSAGSNGLDAAVSVPIIAAALGGRLDLAPPIGLRADLSTGFTPTRITVVHSSHEVATFARPIVSLAIGLDVSW